MTRLIKCLTVALLLTLASCGAGTGAPDWDLPLTWDRDGGSVTLDDGGRAEVVGIPHGVASCGGPGTADELVTGEGEWSWDGLGRMIVVVNDVRLAVYAPSYRGGLDWTRLLVDRCGADFDGQDPVELFLKGPFSAVDG